MEDACTPEAVAGRKEAGGTVKTIGTIEEGFIQKIRQRSSLLLGVTKFLQFLFCASYFALGLVEEYRRICTQVSNSS